MTKARKTPLAAILQGLCAGLLGNAVFTGYQKLAAEQPEEQPRDWSEAPEPAQVGQRLSEGVFQRRVPLEHAGRLTSVVHWVYGTSWGGVYALLEESIRQPILSGVALTGAVMATDYTLLPAMNLYKPPWQYPAKTLGKDFVTHLVHGLATAGAYRALDALLDRRR